MKNRLWKNIEAELHVPVNMDEAVEEPKEEVYDVMKEPRKEEVELQLQEDKPCVEEDINTLNGNGDGRENIYTNFYYPINRNN